MTLFLEWDSEQKKLREEQAAEMESLRVMVSELKKDHKLQLQSLRKELQRQAVPFNQVNFGSLWSTENR